MSRCVRRLIAAVGLVVVALLSAQAQTPAPHSAKEDLPTGAVARFGTTRFRHGESIFSLAFAPDGKTLFCDDKGFDAASGRLVAELPGEALALSADGKFLAGPRAYHHAPNDSQFAVWDRATGREMAHFAPFDKQRSYQVPFTAAAFSSDGRLLAVGAVEHAPPIPERFLETVFLYDLSTGKLRRKFRPARNGPAFLSFSPDGTLLATSGRWNEPIQLWRTADGQEVRKLAGHEEHRHWIEHRPAVFSPDGKLVAAAGKDNTVVFWETITGQEVYRLSGHGGAIRSLAFAADGRTLLSASADTTALL